ncbi:MAG: hypothetical protein ACLGIP_13255, partial [Alphaproteobacteria bacterium]
MKTIVAGVCALGLGLVWMVWSAALPPAAISVVYDALPQRAPIVVMLGGSEGGRFAPGHPMVVQ